MWRTWCFRQPPQPAEQLRYASVHEPPPEPGAGLGQRGVQGRTREADVGRLTDANTGDRLDGGGMGTGPLMSN